MRRTAQNCIVVFDSPARVSFPRRLTCVSNNVARRADPAWSDSHISDDVYLAVQAPEPRACAKLLRCSLIVLQPRLPLCLSAAQPCQIGQPWSSGELPGNASA